MQRDPQARLLDFLGARPRKDHFEGRLLFSGALPAQAAWILGEGVWRLGFRPGGPARLLVVVARTERAEELASDLASFLGAGRWVTVLPPPGTLPHSDVATDPLQDVALCGSLFRILQGLSGPIVVASVQALLQRVVPRRPFDALCDLVGPGQDLDRDAFVALLERAGFRRAPVVEEPGTFAVRGGILDFFAPGMDHPVRLELDGDQVTHLRAFDPKSQRSLEEIQEAYVHPVRQTILTDPAGVRERLNRAAEASQAPSSEVRRFAEYLDQGLEFYGAEALLPAFHRSLDPVSAYLPAEVHWLLEDEHLVRHEAERLWERLQEGFEHFRSLHRLTFPPEAYYARIEDLPLSTAVAYATTAAPGAGPPEVTLDVANWHELVAEVRRAASQRGAEVLAPVAREVRAWSSRSARVYVACPDEHRTRRFASFLRGYGLEVSERSRDAGPVWEALEPGQVLVGPGRISAGFAWREADLAVLSEVELFGRRSRPSRRQGERGGDAADLGRLNEGDYVVHELHGIGRYLGLVRKVIAGVPGDFMALEYAGGDKLFLPVHRFASVRRYVGASPDRPPRLDRLGGVSWARKKKKVAGQVRKLAEQLLKLQAKRQTRPGHAFGDGGELMAAFELSFPYEETEDQAAAIQAVLQDMTSGRPMDRLVCGDVGFGKTEVAMRAAALAVLGGKQVAVLAPTTVLAEQHLRTFRDRMRILPIRVEGLTRFVPRTKQREILVDLAQGKVDILVGTHRILSTDVRFRDLGLVVIDEEQRFGVAQKERLKALRAEVDVLSLTATPIPRTLEMAMVGLKDLSIIATAPADRRAVRTYVCGYQPQTLRDAIRREIRRGGQVYFVVPRIGDEKQGNGERRRGKAHRGLGRARPLEWWADRVAEWVPEARLAVAHGRMSSADLEAAMLRFVRGDVDVLVSTNIVESGLDVPNANTMIVAHADLFGMAQLYQLRGRVGRSARQAYCYFVVDSLDALQEGAARRLAALERLSGLGAAFSLAVEDLEIRGAGDLLGKKQSGQVAEVGFDAYVRLLEDAVAELQQASRPTEPVRECELLYDVPAFLPEDWVPEPGRRLHYYQRLSAARNEQEISDVFEELLDLYGHPVPAEAEFLREITELRLLAERLGAERLELAGIRLVLDLPKEAPLDLDALLALVKNDRRFRLDPNGQILFRVRGDTPAHRLAIAREGLTILAERTLRRAGA